MSLIRRLENIVPKMPGLGVVHTQIVVWNRNTAKEYTLVLPFYIAQKPLDRDICNNSQPPPQTETKFSCIRSEVPPLFGKDVKALWRLQRWRERCPDGHWVISCELSAMLIEGSQ